MQRGIVIYALFLFWITHKLIHNEAVEMKFTNAVCESYNKSWVVIHNCRLRAISRNKTVFNFNGTILHPCSNIFIEAQMFKRANGYKPWLFKLNLDGCRFIKNMYNPFAILVYNLFKEYTNVNHTCPYVGSQIMEGFYLRSELLRLPFPTGDYLFAMNWVFDKKKQFSTNLYFAYVEDV